MIKLIKESKKDYLRFSKDGNIVDSNGEIIDCRTDINKKSINLRLKLINKLMNRRGFIFESEYKLVFEEATDKEVKEMLRRKHVIYLEKSSIINNG